MDVSFSESLLGIGERSLQERFDIKRNSFAALGKLEEPAKLLETLHAKGPGRG